jgi:hypothetical protein
MRAMRCPSQRLFPNFCTFHAKINPQVIMPLFESSCYRGVHIYSNGFEIPKLPIQACYELPIKDFRSGKSPLNSPLEAWHVPERAQTYPNHRFRINIFLQKLDCLVEALSPLGRMNEWVKVKCQQESVLLALPSSEDSLFERCCPVFLLSYDMGCIEGPGFLVRIEQKRLLSLIPGYSSFCVKKTATGILSIRRDHQGRGYR